MSFLEIKDVNKSFGKQVAVDHLNLTMEQGEVLALVGPNGAGKSTTIRMILSILLPDTGVILCQDQDIRHMEKIHTGYLPETRGLYQQLSIWRMLEFMGGLRRMSPAQVRQVGKPWLERLNLSEHAHKKVGDLSKGMQQKLQFLTTIMHKPKLLILDEPFSGLDPLNADLFSKIIQDLKKEGTSILFSSHNMDQIERLCDKLAMIVDGQLRLFGPIQSLLADRGEALCRIDYQDEPKIPSDCPWKISVRGRTIEVESSQAEVRQVSRTAMDWGFVSRLTVGQLSLQELYVRTIEEGNHVENNLA